MTDVARRGVVATLLVGGPASAVAPRQGLSDREFSLRAVVTAYARAWRAGDLTRMAALYHDDFTLHYGGAHALSGDHHGKARALAVLAELGRRTNRRLFAIDAILSSPERGGLLVREIFRNAEETALIERLLTYSVCDERLRDCWVYERDEGAVARFVGMDE